jgi:hypothetical protein
MSTTFSLTFIGMLLGGIAMLVTLILAIIKLAQGKSQQALIFGGSFLVALVIVVFSIFQFVNAMKEKAMEAFEDASNKMQDYNYENDYSKNERQYWLDTLDLFTNDAIRSKVPTDFYKNEEVKTDEAGKMVLPFLFPYSLKFDTYNYVADIMVDDSIFVSNVSAFVFDQNFMLAKIDNTSSKELLKQGHSEIEYLLFDLRTGNYENAPNKEKLKDLGIRIGYTGATDLKYVGDAYRGWIGYNEYD